MKRPLMPLCVFGDANPATVAAMRGDVLLAYRFGPAPIVYPTLGVWGGVEECGFAVRMNALDAVAIAAAHGQEAIVVADGDAPGIHYTDGQYTPALGVEAAPSGASDGFTLFTHNVPAGFPRRWALWFAQPTTVTMATLHRLYNAAIQAALDTISPSPRVCYTLHFTDRPSVTFLANRSALPPVLRAAGLRATSSPVHTSNHHATVQVAVEHEEMIPTTQQEWEALARGRRGC